MFNIPFTNDILTMSPEDFIKDILVDKFKIREAYCGFNYSFGYKAKGTPEVLMHEGLKHGFGIHVQEPYKIDNIIVSSTYIRNLIAEGDMERCMKFMGRMYSIGGEVEMCIRDRNGTKSIQGVLGGIDGDVITVTDHDGKECKLRLSESAKANLAVVF